MHLAHTTGASPRAGLPHLAHLSRMTFLSDDSDSSSNDDIDSAVDSQGRFAAFHDGVCYDCVENLMGVRSMLGLPGGLMLDTGVIAHRLDDPPQQTE
eukprot:11897739-Karenia_brevis.AAC.1